MCRDYMAGVERVSKLAQDTEGCPPGQCAYALCNGGTLQGQSASTNLPERYNDCGDEGLSGNYALEISDGVQIPETDHVLQCRGAMGLGGVQAAS